MQSYRQWLISGENQVILVGSQVELYIFQLLLLLFC